MNLKQLIAVLTTAASFSLMTTVAPTVHAANAPSTAAATSLSGEHDMPGTITSIDHKTGVVVVHSAPSNLSVHFPPDSIKDLKKGDKITVHLGFSKS